ncbi:MAG: hypothetical protein HYV07_27850 [Deltaproteobacteria bacterium]|nr:hypothetical protein [Deltaproteobacteria bacterium]
MEVERRIEQVAGRKLVLELPESFENRRVEVIVLTLDDSKTAQSPASPPRMPHPALAGSMVMNGDIFDSVPVDDYEGL